MVEVDIHCNVIKCRKPLSIESQACVTSCSHIFCLDCSKKLFSNALVCPACNTPLSEDSDDIILTQLNPTEEYKSSVLAGLKPDIILDICSRAIAFYEYQTSQELNFRSILQKSTEEKYNLLKGQYDIVTRDLNHIIKVEREKQKAILNDYEVEKKKSIQIYAKLEDKSKQFQKLQVMYEKLKRKSIAPNIQESFGTTQQQPMMIPNSSTSTSRNIMRFNQPQQQQDDDIISRLGRSSSVARSVFIPPPSHHHHQLSGNKTAAYSPPVPPTRIPSPVKSIYSVRYYREENQKAQPQQQQQSPSSPPRKKHNYHRHHNHRPLNTPRHPYNNNNNVAS